MAKDRVGNDIGPIEQAHDWSAIHWPSIKKRVRNLRRRIFRATKNGEWKRVKSLMKLMLRSYANLLLSVRKVTQENQGKRTPGVDKHLALTPKARMKLVREMMAVKAWRVKPAVRIYIPKADGKDRPLGILTIKNRAAQAIVTNALEPCWEAQFESNSYGFRPGRSAQDAIEACFSRLNRQSTHRWVLDADIKGAFDAIDQSFVLNKLGKIPARGLIKAWLESGFVEDEIFNPTERGTQQGGVISPLLANVALDGIQNILPKQFGFVRYADDWVVTAKTEAELKSIKPVIEKWLAERGMVLNDAKTQIVSVQQGFDFLGFNIRHYHGKCLIKPAKAKVLAFLQRIRKWLKTQRSSTAEQAIRNLNPIINGWAQYYRCAVSSKIFGYVHSKIWNYLWQWCKRRHPKKNMGWIKNRYFRIIDGKDWIFFAKDSTSDHMDAIISLIDISRIPILRHAKVRGSASPDDPSLVNYWMWRSERNHRILANPGSSQHAVRKMLRA
jgi:RNA-directed DNA polymerase